MDHKNVACSSSQIQQPITMMRTSATSACRCHSLLPSLNLFTVWWRWLQWFWYDKVGETLFILRLRSISFHLSCWKQAHVLVVRGVFRRTPHHSHLIYVRALKTKVMKNNYYFAWCFRFSSGSRMWARILWFWLFLMLASLLYEAILSLFHHFSNGRKLGINNIFIFVSYTGVIRGILRCAKWEMCEDALVSMDHWCRCICFLSLVRREPLWRASYHGATTFSMLVFFCWRFASYLTFLSFFL